MRRQVSSPVRFLFLAAASLALMPAPEAHAQRIKRRPADSVEATPAASSAAAPAATAPAASPQATPAGDPAAPPPAVADAMPEVSGNNPRMRRRRPDDTADASAPQPVASTRAPAAAAAPETGSGRMRRRAAEGDSTAPPAVAATPPAPAEPALPGASSFAAAAATTQPNVFETAETPARMRPLGYAGASPVEQRGKPPSADFVPVEDRWRIGFPQYELYVRGHSMNPYAQNVLKGDYPIAGQNTFLSLELVSDTVFEKRQVPTPSGNSTARPDSKPFFGRGDQNFYRTNGIFSINVFHGNAGFRPVDWQFRLTPVVNLRNKLAVEEVGVVLPNVQQGTERYRSDVAFQEMFAEVRLVDVSPNFDFVSARIGRQSFISDFRGFIFSDSNSAIRFFGNAESNRDQYNLIYFKMLEHEINSDLLDGENRHQGVAVANFYRQDFMVPGYTTQLSVHYNRDRGLLKYDENGFLQRPASIGTIRPTGGNPLEVYYLGWTGDGHLGKTNITHAFYVVKGHDSFNPLAGRNLEVDAHMAALELSEDHDWLRLKLSALWASGDSNPSDGTGGGFDSILDNPNFAGGGFSFLTREGLKLTGVNLFNPNSIYPDLRSSKFQGQSNFVNPGLQLAGLGAEAELTPKIRLFANGNLLRFDRTQSLELLLNQAAIHQSIGVDISLAAQYRPELNQNILVTGGFNKLMTSAGFKDIYEVGRDPYSVFSSLTLRF